MYTVLRLYIIIFTRWSCLCPRAREIISRGGRIPTTRSPAHQRQQPMQPAVALRECACMCDVANDDRCVDGKGVGGYGGYGWRRGRCVPRSRWPYTSPGSHDLPCTLYTHKVPFSWISFFWARDTTTVYASIYV